MVVVGDEDARLRGVREDFVLLEGGRSQRLQRVEEVGGHWTGNHGSERCHVVTVRRVSVESVLGAEVKRLKTDVQGPGVGLILLRAGRGDGLRQAAPAGGWNLQVVAAQQNADATKGLGGVQGGPEAHVHGDQHRGRQHGHLIHNQEVRLGEHLAQGLHLVVAGALEQVLRPAAVLGHPKPQQAVEGAGSKPNKGRTSVPMVKSSLKI